MSYEVEELLYIIFSGKLFPSQLELVKITNHTINSYFMFFIRFANCFPVKGICRSVLCDVQRSRLQFIPNDLYDLLAANLVIDFEALLRQYDYENKKIIQEYFDFLVEQEYGVWGSKETALSFKEISTEFKRPGIIDNIIVDISEITFSYLKDIRHQVDTLQCHAIQFRFFDMSPEVETLYEINDIFKGSLVKSLEIYCKYSTKYMSDKIDRTLDRMDRLCSIYFSSSPKDLVENRHGVKIVYTSKKIENHKSCGNVSKNYFSLNINAYAEALAQNSCLNRKISIDVNGNIKNCPSMVESFGNIRNTNLIQVAEKKGFKKYWNITKDSVIGCKDCEFRYICSDCRAFLEEPENIYSKPLKCGYNPQTGEWTEWSINPLKQKAIDFYSMQDILEAKNSTLT